jgi:predicted dinucleotide-binding enzyme
MEDTHVSIAVLGTGMAGRTLAAKFHAAARE